MSIDSVSYLDILGDLGKILSNWRNLHFDNWLRIYPNRSSEEKDADESQLGRYFEAPAGAYPLRTSRALGIGR